MSKRDSDWTTFKAIRFGGGSPTEAGVQTITAAGHITLGYNLGSGVTLLERNIVYMDPGGSARNLILPAEADSMGAWLIIVNTADASEIITVQDDTPATVASVGQSEQAIVVCDGTTWRGATAPGSVGLTASAAEINAVADVSARIVSLTDANATLTVANSGRPHLVANVSADRTFTLPAVSSGLEYLFQSTVSAADGHDWIIITDADDNSEFFLGGLSHNDPADDTVDPILSDGNSNDTMQINVPDAGTWVKFISDGTNWIISGFVVAAAAPTLAD